MGWFIAGLALGLLSGVFLISMGFRENLKAAVKKGHITIDGDIYQIRKPQVIQWT